MKRMTTITALLLALLAAPALAQEPGGEGEEYDLLGAVKRVAELLTESEALLIKSLAPRPKEPEATPEEAAETGREAREAIDELIRKSEASGREASRKIMEILENAPRGKGQGEGTDQKSDPSSKDDEKRRSQEKKVDDRDPQNSKAGDPKGGERNKSKPRTGSKPPQKKGKPRRPDPTQEWLASLPEQVRQDYLNGDWGRIPQKWRDHIKAYKKALNEAESGGGD